MMAMKMMMRSLEGIFFSFLFFLNFILGFLNRWAWWALSIDGKREGVVYSTVPVLSPVS